MSEDCQNCEKLKRERDFWRRLFRYRLFEHAPDLGISPWDWQYHSWLTEGVSDADIDWVLNIHPSYLPSQNIEWNERVQAGEGDFLRGFLVPPRSVLPTRDIPNTPTIEETKVELLPPAPTAELVLKECNRCMRTQPLEEFATHRTNSDGHSHICRTCYKEDNLARKAIAENGNGNGQRVLMGRFTMAVNEAIRHIKKHGQFSDELGAELAQKHELPQEEVERALVIAAKKIEDGE